MWNIDNQYIKRANNFIVLGKTFLALYIHVWEDYFNSCTGFDPLMTYTYNCKIYCLDIFNVCKYVPRCLTSSNIEQFTQCLDLEKTHGSFSITTELRGLTEAWYIWYPVRQD